MRHGLAYARVLESGVEFVEDRKPDIRYYAAGKLQPRVGIDRAELVRRQVAGEVGLPGAQPVQPLGNLRHRGGAPASAPTSCPAAATRPIQETGIRPGRLYRPPWTRYLHGFIP